MSPEARAFISERGGAVHVWPVHHGHGCCGGGLVLLEVATSRPEGDDLWDGVVADGVVVFLSRLWGREPDELQIELRGTRRPRLRAYFDHCAFIA